MTVAECIKQTAQSVADVFHQYAELNRRLLSIDPVEAGRVLVSAHDLCGGEGPWLPIGNPRASKQARFDSAVTQCCLLKMGLKTLLPDSMLGTVLISNISYPGLLPAELIAIAQRFYGTRKNALIRDFLAAKAPLRDELRRLVAKKRPARNKRGQATLVSQMHPN